MIKSGLRKTDLSSEPFLQHQHWCVEETLYPENRGYKIHRFETEQQAIDFINETCVTELKKLPKVSKKFHVPVEMRKLSQSDLDHLKFIYERMSFIHKESQNIDYMKRFRLILCQQQTWITIVPDMLREMKNLAIAVEDTDFNLPQSFYDTIAKAEGRFKND